MYSIDRKAALRQYGQHRLTDRAGCTGDSDIEFSAHKTPLILVNGD